MKMEMARMPDGTNMQKEKYHYLIVKYFTMTKFITNIQLQDTDEKDYDTLYKELEKESFKDEKYTAKRGLNITGKRAFSRAGNITLADVSNAFFRAACKTGKKCSFFVMKNKPLVNANQ
ncbi:MAG: hypothetical protein ABI707_12620 [Ferruginibacter sp.]